MSVKASGPTMETKMTTYQKIRYQMSQGFVFNRIKVRIWMPSRPIDCLDSSFYTSYCKPIKEFSVCCVLFAFGFTVTVSLK